MQTEFRTALLDPDRTVPAGLTDPQGRPAGRRFSVYRNNVAVSLTEAMRTAFPVVEKLVGEDFFTAMAGIFLRAHPPTSPLLMFYGQEMPDFLVAFEPVAHLGYLPDVARLELALRESYHAADATPADLSVVTPDALMAAHLVFAPPIRLIRSDWPLYGIWASNARAAAPPRAMTAEDVLVVRPEFDPAPLLLPAGAGAFIAGLMAGKSFGDALDAAEGIDLTATLGLLISSGAITDILPGDTQ
jgi:hypothetical protein